MPELLRVAVPALVPDMIDTALIVAVAPLRMNEFVLKDPERLSENSNDRVFNPSKIMLVITGPIASIAFVEDASEVGTFHALSASEVF